jgi:hypothetical protein
LARLLSIFDASSARILLAHKTLVSKNQKLVDVKTAMQLDEGESKIDNVVGNRLEDSEVKQLLLLVTSRFSAILSLCHQPSLNGYVNDASAEE